MTATVAHRRAKGPAAAPGWGRHPACRIVRSAAVAAACAGQVSCYPPPPGNYDHFVLPASVFDLRGKTVALVPASVPDELEGREAIGRLVDSMILATLAPADFTTVPAAEYAAIWDRLTREAGGFFDPYTGERDEPKFEAAVRQLHRELEALFHPDVLLYPELWIVEAPIRDGLAHWDGTQRQVYGIPVDGGAALALSLVVVMEDEGGQEVFNNGWGVGLYQWADLGSGGIRTATAEELFEAVFAGDAVAEVLAPLLKPPEPGG